MSKDITRYFLHALYVIKSCRDLLLAYLLLCLYQSGIAFFPKDIQSVLSVFLLVFYIFLVPVAYGRYIEVINNETHISYVHILKTHVVNYYMTVLLLFFALLPLFIIFVAIVPDEYYNQLQYFVALFIKVLSIYILPLVFFLKDRKKALVLGFKCLAGNIGDSLFLIILVLFNIMIAVLLANYGENIGEVNNFVNSMLVFIVGLLSMLIECVVFVMAALILNNKLLKA